MLEDERRNEDQRQLMRKARRLYIPIPDYKSDSGDWEDSRYLYNYKFLTEKAIKTMRADIREELRGRREMILGWVAPFSGIIGTLVGSVIGYIFGTFHR